MTTDERIAWRNFFLEAAQSTIRTCWYLLAIVAICIALAWYFNDGGIGRDDEWVEISPNGNGGDPAKAHEAVKESVLT